jgi:cytochrome oxidase Cu insertion factor (SCO1/SenC/PrrC family)
MASQQQEQPQEQATRPTGRTPESDDFSTGPAIGEPLPDFTLSDQRGEPVNFSRARDGKRALVIFHRSARW